MSEKTCPACSAQNRLLAKFCRKCGSHLPEHASSEQTPAASQNQPAVSQPQTDAQSVAVTVEQGDSASKSDGLDYIALEEIRSRLQNFINTLLIRQKQKTIGMPVSENTNVLVFRGETGTGKSLVAECFIALLKKSHCLSSNTVARTTAHKFQRQYSLL